MVSNAFYFIDYLRIDRKFTLRCETINLYMQRLLEGYRSLRTQDTFVPKILSYPRLFRTKNSFVPEITTSTYCIKEVLIISIVL